MGLEDSSLRSEWQRAAPGHDKAREEPEGFANSICKLLIIKLLAPPQRTWRTCKEWSYMWLRQPFRASA